MQDKYSNDQKFEFGINIAKPNFAEQIILSEITDSINSVQDNSEECSIKDDLYNEKLRFCALNKSFKQSLVIEKYELPPKIQR